WGVSPVHAEEHGKRQENRDELPHEVAQYGPDTEATPDFSKVFMIWSKYCMSATTSAPTLTKLNPDLMYSIACAGLPTVPANFPWRLHASSTRFRASTTAG